MFVPNGCPKVCTIRMMYTPLLQGGPAAYRVTLKSVEWKYCDKCSSDRLRTFFFSAVSSVIFDLQIRLLPPAAKAEWMRRFVKFLPITKHWNTYCQNSYIHNRVSVFEGATMTLWIQTTSKQIPCCWYAGRRRLERTVPATSPLQQLFWIFGDIPGVKLHFPRKWQMSKFRLNEISQVIWTDVWLVHYVETGWLLHLSQRSWFVSHW